MPDRTRLLQTGPALSGPGQKRKFGHRPSFENQGKEGLPSGGGLEGEGCKNLWETQRFRKAAVVAALRQPSRSFTAALPEIHPPRRAKVPENIANPATVCQNTTVTTSCINTKFILNIDIVWILHNQGSTPGHFERFGTMWLGTSVK